MNDNQDLLDLCRLNLMEDNIKDSVAPDINEVKKAIDYKKRTLVTRIINNPPSIAHDVMERHIKGNTFHFGREWSANGSYSTHFGREGTEDKEEIFEEDEI